MIYADFETFQRPIAKQPNSRRLFHEEAHGKLLKEHGAHSYALWVETEIDISPMKLYGQYCGPDPASHLIYATLEIYLHTISKSGAYPKLGTDAPPLPSEPVQRYVCGDMITCW